MRVTKKLAVERPMLKSLPTRRTAEYEELPARVSKYAIFTVRARNTAPQPAHRAPAVRSATKRCRAAAPPATLLLPIHIGKTQIENTGTRPRRRDKGRPLQALWVLVRGCQSRMASITSEPAT